MNFLSRIIDTLRLYLRYPQTILCVLTERRFTFLEIIAGFTFGHALIALPLPQALLVGLIVGALDILLNMLHLRLHRSGTIKNFYGLTQDDQFVATDLDPRMPQEPGVVLPVEELPEDVRAFFTNLMLKDKPAHLRMLNIYVSPNNPSLLMQDGRDIGIVLPTIGSTDKWHWVYRGRQKETQAKSVIDFASVSEAMDDMIEHALREQWQMPQANQQPAEPHSHG